MGQYLKKPTYDRVNVINHIIKQTRNILIILLLIFHLFLVKIFAYNFDLNPEITAIVRLFAKVGARPNCAVFLSSVPQLP